MSETWTRHIAGPVVGGLQKCVRCGFPLANLWTRYASLEWSEGQPVYEKDGAKYWQVLPEAEIRECEAR